MFCRSLFVLLSFFFWTLCCLFFFFWTLCCLFFFFKTLCCLFFFLWTLCCLFFFFWTLCCLFFSDLWICITSLVSSKSSCLCYISICLPFIYKSRKTFNLFLGFADNFCILTTLTQRICPVLFYEKNNNKLIYNDTTLTHNTSQSTSLKNRQI